MSNEEILRRLAQLELDNTSLTLRVGVLESQVLLLQEELKEKSAMNTTKSWIVEGGKVVARGDNN